MLDFRARLVSAGLALVVLLTACQAVEAPPKPAPFPAPTQVAPAPNPAPPLPAIASPTVAATSTPLPTSTPEPTATATPAPPTPTATPAVSNEQRIAWYTKPAVVKIYDGCYGAVVFQPNGRTYRVQYLFSGSGFIANPNGYIVTDAHVVENTHAGLQDCETQLLLQYVQQLAQDAGQDWHAIVKNRDLLTKILQVSQFQGVQQVHHVVLPNGKLLPFEIKAYGAPTADGGKDLAVIKIEVQNAPVLRLGDSDQVQVMDHVIAVGYPGVADSSALAGSSQLQASFTDGRVSAEKVATSGASILQVSAPAAHGSSGGPVLNDQGEVIGVVTFVGDDNTDATSGGFVFVTVAKTIDEYLRQAGTTNDEGLTDQRYRDGLNLYWTGQYAQAIAKFEEVKRLFPDHSEVDSLLRLSQEKLAWVDGESPAGPAPTAPGGAGGGAASTP